MLRILGTIFAALLGLCFGSFLNVCLSRWPRRESVVRPRSHCRKCGRTLTWWENVPLVSWVALRGRCRGCGAWISVRYPLVEVAVGVLWAAAAWNFLALATDPEVPAISPFLHWNLYNSLGRTLGLFLFFWLLVGLAFLDIENFWLPDWLTLPGVLVGALSRVVYRIVGSRYSDAPVPITGAVVYGGLMGTAIEIAIAAGIILLIRWVYRLIRRREGMGLGDAKLMAMLAAWLGLPGALLSLFIGVVLGAVFAVAALLRRSRSSDGSWAALQLPLGTFLCVGGIVSALWGERIIAAYMGMFL
ncbi:MAG TPA: prepilin peptidase [Terracidiphilus sp.]|jgi:leader peptidase (prepilin peptidase)/N-methyltransferase